MAVATLSFKCLEQNLCEDMVDKIAANLHGMYVKDLHTEMELELSFLKRRTPIEGLKKLFPNVLLYVHLLNEQAVPDPLFDSFCIMDRVIIYKLNDTELLVLSELTDYIYHTGYYTIDHMDRTLTLQKDKVYIRNPGYGPSTTIYEEEFIKDALDLHGYTVTYNKKGADKWLLGGIMINWLLSVSDKELLQVEELSS